MSNISYKKIGVSILAYLENQDNKAIGITSSNPQVDVYEICKNIGEAFKAMDISVSLVNKEMQAGTVTASSAKSFVDSAKQSAQITLIALDNIVSSDIAMMVGGCCDGILMTEKKNSSCTDKIEQTLSAIKSVFVEPIGFVLI